VTEIPKGDYTIYRVPISDIAVSEIGKAVVTNIVALGILTKISGVASEEAVRKAILARVPKGTEEINMKAFDAGLRTGGELLESSKKT
jgi:2-oxoglutarate ferredoxin oxidoreductase subunit gamma